MSDDDTCLDVKCLDFLSAEQGKDGVQYNLEIKHQRAVSQIVDVHPQSLEHLVHGIRISVVQSCLGCQSRLHLIDKQVVGVLLHDQVDVVFPFRPWTYKAHVALQNIPELRKFVKMIPSEETRERSGIYVVGCRHELRPVVLTVRFQGSELVNSEGFSAIAYPLL